MKKTLCAAVLVSSLAFSRATGQTADPIEGKWLGKAGFPQDRIDLGFEFKRNEKGELKAYLYEPVLNFYGLEMPGVVEKQGDQYVHKEYVINLTLRDGKLEGTYFPLNAPATLERTDRLPTEAPVPDLPRGPEPKWRAKLGSAIYAAAVVRDGTAYVGTTGGSFYAVRVDDGAFLWTFVPGRPVHGAALASDEHLYFVCDNGYLFKLDRKTGKEIWRYDLGDARVARALPHQVLDKIGVGEFDFDSDAPQPLLSEGVLYVGSGDGGFHAVNASTGQRMWRFEGKGKLRTTPFLDGERLFFGSSGGTLYAVDRKTGKEIWNKDTRAEVTSSPLVVAGKLIVGNRGGLLAALNPSTGEVIWRATFWGSAIESTPVPAEDGLFYIGSSDLRRVSLIDSKDGRVVWRTDVYGWAWPRPTLSGPLLYQSAIGFEPYDIRHFGSLTALDRKTGKIVWRWPTPACADTLMTGFHASPVVDGKTIVVGGLDGTLYGFPAG
jgi:outer membrane protein assembly factor BamB